MSLHPKNWLSLVPRLSRLFHFASGSGFKVSVIEFDVLNTMAQELLRSMLGFRYMGGARMGFRPWAFGIWVRHNLVIFIDIYM